MKTVLITGAYGQLGLTCRKTLKSYFNILPTGRKTFSDGIELDISDNKMTEKVLSENHPDVILNLAAITNVDACELSPNLAEATNLGGVQNLCKNFEGHFIQISTDYVFDGASGPYSERINPNPISVYGKTKLAAEQWLAENHQKTTIVRTNVVYSYSERAKASFVKWVIDSLSSEKPIRVVNDQWNNPTWTESIVSVLKLFLEKEIYGLYHYGDKGYMNRYTFAQMIAEVFELDSSLITPISTRDLNQPAPRPLKSGLETEKVESALGINPNSVETCLREIRSQISK